MPAVVFIDETLMEAPFGTNGRKLISWLKDTMKEQQKEYQAIKELDLFGAALSDDGIIEIKSILLKCIGLEKLDLGGNRLSTEDAVTVLQSALPALANITELDLSDNGIADKGISILAGVIGGLINLRWLGISNNKVTGIGLEKLLSELCHLKRLTGLALSNNQLTDTGAKALAFALPSLPELQKLHLWNTNISDEGATALISCAPLLPQLSDVWLFGNPALSEPLHRDFTTRASIEELVANFPIKNPVMHSLALLWKRMPKTS